ncbi:hypothetical protein BJX66DRAFT_329964 [Aspergillus keveii]|uniref:F-box domain-containing protein n=1 Tax=Aspergillus keveii TaxID=714993 RepID=A0ABR4FN76_9EURO
MRHQLPPEILMQVAEYLDYERSNNPSLAKCTRVCRQWQPVFERRIYNKVRVYSEEVQKKKGSYNRVSFPHFQALVSNQNEYRRSFVRKLEYTVIIPYEVPTYQATKQANDQAFRAVLYEFFEFLTSWEGPQLTVALGVKGREETQEPETNAHKSVWEWQNEFYGDRVVLPYGARLPGGVTMLPEVSCVEHLEFDHTAYDIWIGTIMQIAECCVALKRLDVDTMYRVRPDHLDFMRKRRQALASGLAKLPKTLEVFRCEGANEWPWSNTLPALDLRPANSEIDDLSVSIRSLSCRLRELHLDGMSVDMNLLFPLDDSGTPRPDAFSLHWPHLERVIFHMAPMHLPSGEWLFEPELETGNEEELPDPSTGDEIFENTWLVGDYEICREVMNTEHFHRLFISIGYAARRMPRLKTIEFSIPSSAVGEFKFVVSGRGGSWDGGMPRLKSSSTYRPDRRVAEAWGYDLDSLLDSWS